MSILWSLGRGLSGYPGFRNGEPTSRRTTENEVETGVMIGFMGIIISHAMVLGSMYTRYLFSTSFPFCFGISLLQQNARKKGTVTSTGNLVHLRYRLP